VEWWNEEELMEEEVLIVREGSTWTFNLPREVFARLVSRHVEKLSPLAVSFRGNRVLLKLERERAEELRVWLLLNLNKGFFVTELECLDLR